MNCSASLWARLELPGRVLTPELTETSIERQVDRLLDELPAGFALAGLSLGAVVAMALTRRAPDRVRRLCLMSTNAREPTAAQRHAWRQQRERLARGATARDLQGMFLPTLLSPPTLAGRPDLVEATLGMAGEVGETALDAQLQQQTTRIDERPGLTRVRCPTLIIAAQRDALCSVSRHREARALIPNAELVILSESGHLSPLEAPGRLTKTLERWR